MQELRLVGVQEDGRHLELAAADGKRYKVCLLYTSDAADE